MKIELKNLKINKSFSEETVCFTADIIADGKKIGYAKNDGHGGCTYIGHYPNMREELEKAEAYCKTLPPLKFGKNEFPNSLEFFVDGLVDDKWNEGENKKAEKKIQKKCETHICWGIPNSTSFNVIGFKGSPKLELLLSIPHNKLAVENLYKRVKKELQEGEVIFNKNLPFN